MYQKHPKANCRQDRHKCWYPVSNQDYVLKHKFFVSTITSCFLNRLCSLDVLSIGTVFAETRWSSGGFPLPNSVFEVSHSLYYYACSFPPEIAFEFTRALLHDIEVGMWALVSRRENPDENVLQNPPVLKFYLEIIKTRGQ